MFLRKIFNIIFWTTPTKKTGVSLFGGVNSKGGLISIFAIFSKAKNNSIGILGSIFSYSERGVAGGGFFNIISYSNRGEAGSIIFSLISIAPKGSTYGTMTFFAKDFNNSTEHHLCLLHPKRS